jgi:aspartyl-tRNA(Asn)/glutamyl-tRNA(Gln) amidotransferase subunit A
MELSQDAQRTLAEVSELVRKRKVSPVELTQDCLRRIEELNPAINAFITVTAEQALQEARQAEAEISRGNWRGPLHGIPFSVKDLIDTAGVRTTAGSELFKDRVPAEDATVVQRLRQAGAVLLGKTNLHEFAYGGSSMVSYFGAVRNPWDQRRIAGGSSGGAAAAVASGVGFAALGTDTAGSIRLPSALCGAVGFKPSYGLVSTRGVIPLSWSYDHVGPITRTVHDAALVLQAIAGYDAQDPASVPYRQQDYATAMQRETAGLRVGVPAAFFCDDLDREIAAAFEAALSTLDRLTAGHRKVEVPADPDYTVHICEAFTFHAKFVAESPNLYQPETLRRIRSGEKVTVADYIQKRRELDGFRHGAAEVFRDVDVIVTPATPRLAPVIAELEKEPKELRRNETVLLRNTRPFSILGAPAISAPCGFSSSGLPIGLQIAGRPGEDATVMALAAAYERAVK